ncbi:iron permease [Daedaleopsis nitida]|nr:iron permease [Daedaleopsis nitida]
MDNSPVPEFNPGLDFWMVYVSNLTVDLLSALDLSAISTALPTIVGELHGTDFIWAGSAYTIAATGVLPLIGNLVDAFGRKPVLISFILMFAIGSAISGAAQTMNMLIAGRAIQGFGGGGCIAITEIIYADLVPLPSRGKYQGVQASIWAFACSIGPPIGGALADHGAWRWLFFLNIPVCGIASLLTLIFLKVRTPKAPLKDKLAQMDWTGIIVMIGSTVSILLAITWGGVQYPWTSARVLVPLIIGAVGIAVFFVLELFWLKGPTVPQFFFKNRTAFSGYIGTFIHGIVALSTIYYLPVYFQASHGASAVGSGIDMFALCIIIPVSAIASAVAIQLIGRYVWSHYLGWALTIAGFGVLSTLSATSTRPVFICAQLPLAVGLGIIWIATQFPILAPLPVSNNAHALAFFTFLRNFAQSWGIRFPQGVQIAYAVIPTIGGLEDPALKAQVRETFARATQLIWRVMIGFSGAGLLTVLLMREEKMRSARDAKWDLKEAAAGSKSDLKNAGSGSVTPTEMKEGEVKDFELPQVLPVAEV